VAGGWWLVAGGWWLVAGEQKLELSATWSLRKKTVAGPDSH